MTTARRAATIIATAGLAAAATAQTDFNWISTTDGNWSDAANWSAAGTPGASSVLDTATIDAIGSYTVFLDTSRAIADLAITNADATVQFNPNQSLNVSGSVTGPGTLIISNGASTFDSRLTMGANSTIDTRVILNGFATFDADLQLPADPLTPTTLGPNGIISGQGNITGTLVSQGVILADNGTIDLSLTNSRLEGGTVRQEPTGNIQWDGHTIANLTIENDLILDPNESVVLDTGVAFTNEIVISDGASTFDARLTVLDGVTINTTINLQGFQPSDADLDFPPTPGQSATLGPAGVIRGQGNITGFLNNQGLIIADNGQIDLSLADTRVDGGMIQQTASGDIRWDAHTIANLTVIDDLIIDPNEVVFVDTGVTFTGDIIISEGTSTFDARLNVLDGVTIDTTVVLQGFQAGDADIIFPNTAGESATLGTNGVITGQGEIFGYLINQGRIVATPGNQIDFSLADLTINGGTIEQQPGGDFRWDNHTVTNANLEGQIIVDPSEILNIGANVTFTEGVTVSNANSTFNAILNLADGVDLDTTVTLLGLATNDARLAGPVSPESATLNAASTLAGQGVLEGNITEINGRIAPDDEGTGGTIALNTGNALAFAPTTELAIDLYSAADFDNLTTNASLTLAGTLSLVPDAAYVPTLGDEFIVITSGLPMTGTFDTISPIPGTTPYIVRARYEPTRVTAIITCLQDLSGDGVTDIDDVLAFLNAFGNQDAIADLALPIGEFNIDDVLTFLDLFAQGCF